LDGFKIGPAPPQGAAAQQDPDPNPDQDESAPDNRSDNDFDPDKVGDEASVSSDGKEENGSKKSHEDEEMEDEVLPDTQMPGIVPEHVGTIEEDTEITQGDEMLADLGTAETQPSTQSQNEPLMNLVAAAQLHAPSAGNQAAAKPPVCPGMQATTLHKSKARLTKSEEVRRRRASWVPVLMPTPAARSPWWILAVWKSVTVLGERQNK